MSYIYFDESIQNRGDFIIGAMVASPNDLSEILEEAWRNLGLDPVTNEYKSSSVKISNPSSQAQRSIIRDLLPTVKLGLVVCPVQDRNELGNHMAALLLQLLSKKLLAVESHQCFVDDGIKVDKTLLEEVKHHGVIVRLSQDSRKVAGIQVADHAAHALGGMLLEEMGVVSKMVSCGTASGRAADLRVELGFELWAGLRYSLIGRNEEMDGLSVPGEKINPYFSVNGYGLYVAPSCSEQLRIHANTRFGTNYLGCID